MRVDGDLVWWSPPTTCSHPRCRLHRFSLAAARGARVRDQGRHRVRRRDSRLCRSGAPARLDRRLVRRCLRGAPPARVGALDRGVGRRRARGWPLRRRDRRASSPPSPSSTAARAPRRRRSWRSSLRLETAGGPRLLDVQWMTPHLRSLGAIEVTRAEYHVLLDERFALGRTPSETRRPAEARRHRRRAATTGGRCRS